LDIGGGANEEQVIRVFDIFLKNTNIQGILVTLFGGIVRCNVVARGMINAVGATRLRLPLVVRLEGTNAMEEKQLLEESGLRIVFALNIADGAKQIITLSR
jgi:succinyl-CoA synthetase beta subunit